MPKPVNFPSECAAAVAVGLAALLGGCTHFEPGSAGRSALQTPRLFAELPDFCPTPDGMAVAPDGDLVVACPNFADQTKPACLLRFGREKTPWLWVAVPPLPETGLACPTGIEFGPDGDLYVCDDQGWKGDLRGQFKGRLLRLRIKGTQFESCTVVAEGLEHPNRVRVREGHLYVTQCRMTKVTDPNGLLVSGLYRFSVDDKNIRVANMLNDPNLVATFVTQNRNCPYGADGLVFDHDGHLYVGNFGDGTIHRITFDADGKVASNTVFARSDFDYTLDPQSPGFLAKAVAARMRTPAGMCLDELGDLYVTDFSNNAVVRVTRRGAISIMAQNGDTDGRAGRLDQPGEIIIWNGRLVVTSFDLVTGPDMVNTKHDRPFTMSELEPLTWK